MSEQKRVPRTASHQPASIVLHDPPVLHPCMVLDLTSLGACVLVPVEIAACLPRRFDLTFDQCRTLRGCRVIWRKSNRVGVAWEKTFLNIETEFA